MRQGPLPGNMTLFLWKRRLTLIFRQQPYLILLGLVLIIALFRSAFTSISFMTQPSMWNTQDLDVTTNGNLLLSLWYMETNRNSAPTSPIASDVLKNPSSYFGKYIKVSGTVQSAQFYPAQGGLANQVISNSSETVMLANNDNTIIDCYLVGAPSGLNPGSTITVYGYSPGLKYVQNSQGALTPELVLVGRLGQPSNIISLLIHTGNGS